jgi:hypothetical protein
VVDAASAELARDLRGSGIVEVIAELFLAGVTTDGSSTVGWANGPPGSARPTHVLVRPPRRSAMIAITQNDVRASSSRRCTPVSGC